MRMRRTAAAVAMVAAVTLPAAGIGGVAYAQGSSATASAAKKPAAVKPTKAKPTKAPRKVAFQASGTITAVDASAGTITVAARSGTKDVRRKTVTMTVPAGARIILNGKKITVAGLGAGQKVSVTGTRAGTAYTVSKIQATGKKAKPTPAPSSPSATPTTSPTVEPTTSPTVEPTESAPEEPEASETPEQ
ncbi:hypothetical protein FHR83_007256 [Actinoplanes campanulatus]|uniref:DUF5666 domain-containing protein n=1 Tax=Actinoplanes campanulatus TaxID=113559 RepID=A0A7W5FID6_9ACTN|nr:hypothetical protein [Actinoplanes campanulatus]MBB3099549.1 hypothetical protein [Actinoplanes campanulatus]GGN42301.1 hypothetical protein GCM10010109_73300 [Actinoplanes campanulatus]GID39898.1 hypothetical protein Aca09nite_64040 [Actinoplanes campanulatus]